jgi:hypothetical protein
MTILAAAVVVDLSCNSLLMNYVLPVATGLFIHLLSRKEEN